MGRAVVVAVWLTLTLAGCDRGDDNAAVAWRTVDTAMATAAPAATSQRFAGRVTPPSRVRLAFRVDGPVAALYVREGEEVRAGDALARLDARDYRRRQADLKARLAEAHSRRLFAEIEWQRTKAAADGQGISRHELDRAESAMEQASARAEALQVQLASARDRLADTRLRAPADGVIARRLIDPGELVGAGETVFVFHVSGTWEVEVQVPDRWLPRIQLGDRAVLSFPGHETGTVAARVSAMASEPSAGTGSYSVRLLPLATDQLPPVGAPARAELRLPAPWPANALRVPVTAVVGDRDSGHHLYHVNEKSRVERVAVEVLGGAQRDLIIDGPVAAGSTIVTSGAEYLADGDRVRDRGDGSRAR